MLVIDQRRDRRFDLKLPVEVLGAGVARVSQIATTQNISSRGVLFVSANWMEIGVSVEYVVTLISGRNGVVDLYCIGRVLRIEKKVAEVTHDESIVVAISVDQYEFIRSQGSRPASVM